VTFEVAVAVLNGGLRDPGELMKLSTGILGLTMVEMVAWIGLGPCKVIISGLAGVGRDLSLSVASVSSKPFAIFDSTLEGGTLVARPEDGLTLPSDGPIIRTES